MRRQRPNPNSEIPAPHAQTIRFNESFCLLQRFLEYGFTVITKTSSYQSSYNLVYNKLWVSGRNVFKDDSFCFLYREVETTVGVTKQICSFPKHPIHTFQICRETIFHLNVCVKVISDITLSWAVAVWVDIIEGRNLEVYTRLKTNKQNCVLSNRPCVSNSKMCWFWAEENW